MGRRIRHTSAFTSWVLFVIVTANVSAHNTARPAASTRSLPAPPAPLGVPKPGPATDGPYAPLPILQGGVVLPLCPPGSAFLNTDRVREPEQYNFVKIRATLSRMDEACSHHRARLQLGFHDAETQLELSVGRHGSVPARISLGCAFGSQSP
jgi:hypothetical protein